LLLQGKKKKKKKKKKGKALTQPKKKKFYIKTLVQIYHKQRPKFVCKKIRHKQQSPVAKSNVKEFLTQ
jgi:hypothetical protein